MLRAELYRFRQEIEKCYTDYRSGTEAQYEMELVLESECEGTTQKGRAKSCHGY